MYGFFPAKPFFAVELVEACDQAGDGVAAALFNGVQFAFVADGGAQAVAYFGFVGAPARSVLAGVPELPRSVGGYPEGGETEGEGEGSEPVMTTHGSGQEKTVVSIMALRLRVLQAVLWRCHPAASSGDEVGRAVSAAGDVNGDGIDDLIVAAPEANEVLIAGDIAAIGSSYVVFGSRDFG